MTSLDTKALEHIYQSAKNRELVIIIGAGVSTALSNGTVPSWVGLIKHGLSHCFNKGFIDRNQHDRWEPHLSSNDIDDLLGTAEFMSRKLGAPKSDIYSKWLRDVFHDAKALNPEMVGAIKSLIKANIPICTLNYDSMLEHVSGFPAIRMNDLTGVAEWIRGNREGILHLHGHWETPESCILSIRDYQTTVGNETRDLIQRTLGSFKRLLFIGCGSTFGDPNFSSWIQWLRQNMAAAPLQHYALVHEKDLAEYNKDENWRGFVDPISFGDDFKLLPKFITTHFSNIEKAGPTLPDNDPRKITNEVLEIYRRFIIRDCGQMTIEGIKSDMDTTKQKFDIEKLFVPLDVLACPPEFASNDPERNEKLIAWQKKNSNPIPFGNILDTYKRIALLALPGGGKTMLLKRLAVAYADPARIDISSDQLPKQELFPVLIRCREWREYIRSPILTLLKKLSDITGQSNLNGLSTAIEPLLKQGKVLLLVDGLDEIHNNADRTTFVDHLERFLEDYPDIRLIVTSREAGFSLVAPCLSRFCTRFQVAALSPAAITLLSKYWHVLMAGESPESLLEGNALAKHLIETTALRRLAENPLLLTMLLVVKHGAGRLPPDRVTLYARAVEVLLDTWNIKGHAALNLKEAIPQLACVAFEMMQRGKQTATENELLALLEEARDKVPQIGRYAKDAPYDFLKRVELRSSLLLEAGHQLEKGQTVPFYQFRHLTFQEYLAAVAAANGHFIGYKTRGTVLDPLKAFLLADEWKEVIPMAAVIAGKQAEPLLEALVIEGEKLEYELYAGKEFSGQHEWHGFNQKLPASISRLTQCLVEEAEVSQEILPDALRLVALFARGARSEIDWKSLARGPYGDELIQKSWQLYNDPNTSEEAWARNTCSALAAKRKPDGYWKTTNGIKELRDASKSRNVQSVSTAILTSIGAQLSIDKYEFLITQSIIEKSLFSEEFSIWHAAAWSLGLAHFRSIKKLEVETKTLDRLLELWTKEKLSQRPKIIGFTLSMLAGIERSFWKPVLNDLQRSEIIQDLEIEDKTTSTIGYTRSAACMLAFHSKGLVPEVTLARIISKISWQGRAEVRGKNMLIQMGKVGAKYIKEK